MINVHRKILFRFKPTRKLLLWKRYMDALRTYSTVKRTNELTGGLDEAVRVTWQDTIDAYKEYIHG